MISSTLRQSIAARRAKEGDKGFTLIELLVVVLIIGILAAIAIPVFLGQQNSAKDAAAKSDLANVKLAIVGWYSAGNTAAPAVADLKKFGYSQSTATAPTIFSSDVNTFCVSVPSDSQGNPVYKVTAGAAAIATGAACTSATS